MNMLLLCILAHSGMIVIHSAEVSRLSSQRSNGAHKDRRDEVRELDAFLSVETFPWPRNRKQSES